MAKNIGNIQYADEGVLMPEGNEVAAEDPGAWMLEDDTERGSLLRIAVALEGIRKHLEEGMTEVFDRRE